MESVFSMREAFDAVGQAFSIYTAGGAQVPLRIGLEVAARDAQLLFMPAMAGEAIGTKVVGFFPQNTAKGLPVTPGTMLVFDVETGVLSCIMDGTYLTQVRTAAAAGLATELLATPDARSAALIGLGGQAPCQLLALLEAAPTLEEVRVFDLDPARKSAFATERADWPCRIVPAETADQAVEGAQLVTVVTTARAPVFSYASLGKGVHVNGIGSYQHEMQELPEELVVGCDLLVFDTVEGVLSESGDILKPLAKGLLAGKNLDIEIGHVIAGQVRRKSADEVTLYKGVGSGVLDIVTAAAIYKKALAAGIGTKF